MVSPKHVNCLSGFENLEDRQLMTVSPTNTVEFDLSRRIETEIEAPNETTESVVMRQIEGRAGMDEFHAPSHSSSYLETIHGNDDRIAVEDSGIFPFRSIVRLSIQNGGNGYLCSGAVIGSYHVLTAGHCIYDADDGWAESVTASPAQDGTEKFFGTADVTYMRSYTGWTQDQNFSHDWAILTLDRSIGDHTGWMGREVLSESRYKSGVWLNTAGYPGDMGGTSMYRAYGATSDATDNRVFYAETLDTAGGQSGSAMWRKVDDSRYISVVHTTGGSEHNGGTRLNSDKFDRIQSWMSDDDLIRRPADRPDLVDYDAWFGTNFAFVSDSSVAADETIQVTAYPRNNGTADSGPYQVQYFLSTNDNITEFDIPLGSVTISNTSPFEWSKATLTASIPSDAAGDYYVGWIIDSGDSQSEFNESNNTGVIANKIHVTQQQTVLARDDFAIVGQGQSRTINLLVNDSSDRGAWISSVDQPSFGSVTIIDEHRVQVQMEDAFEGYSYFSYSITDGTTSSTAWVDLTVAIPGDSNLDGVFDSKDLVMVFDAGEYENQLSADSSWYNGDWNHDGEFNSADLVVAFDANRYSASSIAAAVDILFSELTDDIFRTFSRLA